MSEETTASSSVGHPLGGWPPVRQVGTSVVDTRPWVTVWTTAEPPFPNLISIAWPPGVLNTATSEVNGSPPSGRVTVVPVASLVDAGQALSPESSSCISDAVQRGICASDLTPAGATSTIFRSGIGAALGSPGLRIDRSNIRPVVALIRVV